VPFGLDVDSQDRVYVAGTSYTTSPGWATPGAYLETRYPTGGAPFATRIDVDAGVRDYWTWLSSARDTAIYKVVADEQGRAFFVGGGPTTSGLFFFFSRSIFTIVASTRFSNSIDQFSFCICFLKNYTKYRTLVLVCQEAFTENYLAHSIILVVDSCKKVLQI
jgi:hypothetical protein